MCESVSGRPAEVVGDHDAVFASSEVDGPDAVDTTGGRSRCLGQVEAADRGDVRGWDRLPSHHGQ